MKAAVVYEAGGPDKLVVTEVDKPAVKDGWSLVKVMGFGINHSEIFTRDGLSPSVTFPRILGIECVGLVEETTDPDKLPVGQKVISIMGEMGRDFDGSYSEYVLLPNQQIYPVETHLDWPTLAAVPETYYTAYGSLKNMRIQETDTVLVRGATSGVGVAFLHLLKSKYPQVKVDGTSRSLAKEAQLRAVGFDAVVEDRDGQLQTDTAYDKIFELIGPATVKDSFLHLNEGGIVCSTGELGGKWYLEEFDPIMDIKANSFLTSFYSGNVDDAKLNEMLAYIESNHTSVKPEKVLTLDEIGDAHRYLESSHSFGKVVVVNHQ